MTTTYESQAARDAQAMNYGGPGYWRYLDESAHRMRTYFLARGHQLEAASMLTRSLGEALQGNDGP